MLKKARAEMEDVKQVRLSAFEGTQKCLRVELFGRRTERSRR